MDLKWILWCCLGLFAFLVTIATSAEETKDTEEKNSSDRPEPVPPCEDNDERDECSEGRGFFRRRGKKKTRWG